MERNPLIDATTRSNGDRVTTVEAAVLQRYGSAAKEVEACLCLPVSYDKDLLRVIPDEIIEKDYGCGDPSRYIRAGEVVLDLGSGSGKACYIISQIVGAKGKVIGVDFNPPMLELARKHQKSIGDRLGYHNVEFRRGKIQDLKTDLELLDQHLQENPVRSVADLARFEEFESRMRREQPLIADESVDVIVSNCVLNLVRPEDKTTTVRRNVPRAQARRAGCDFRHCHGYIWSCRYCRGMVSDFTASVFNGQFRSTLSFLKGMI